ncbi:MAG: HAMP domain-containing protein [Gammaproteobacteria bacterium]|nr:HAMP domain-containing protein [Gammaproteobacteria bacterium]
MTSFIRWLPSFRTVLSAVITFVVGLVVATLAMLAWDTGHEGIDQTTRLLATEVARGVRGDLDVLVDRPVRVVKQLAKQLYHVGGSSARNAVLREALGMTPEVSQVFFAPTGETGVLVIRPVQDPIVHPLAASEIQAWSASVADTTGHVWGAVYPHDIHKALVLEVAQAMRNADGALLGIVSSGFRLDRLEEMLASYAAEHGAIAFLLDPKGLLLSTHHGHTLDANGARQYAHASDHPVIATVARSVHTLDQDRRVIVNGEPYDAFVYEVAQELPEQWRLVVAVPRARFDAPLRRHMQSMVILTALALLGAVGLALLIARGASQPLHEVALLATRIRDGELDVRFRTHRVRELAHLSNALRSMVNGLRERDRMKDAFARYVSPRLVERVVSDPEALRPGGRLMQAVIAFTDLRGFTALAERLGPMNTVALINRYLDAMMVISDAHGGFITDLMGDGLLIAFGIDNESDAPRKAVRCMLAMQQALEEVNRQNQNEIGIRLEMGAGVHYGEVIVGNIGSASRIKYGVIGDAVNTAARVEALTVGGEVLVSESVYRACGDALVVDPPQEVPVKGKNEPLRVYGVHTLRGPDGLSLPEVAPTAWVKIEVSGRARRLFGKVVSEESFPLSITAVEDRFLLITCDMVLKVHDDLRIDVALGAFYGRVQREEGAGGWLVRWTGGAQNPIALLQN